MNGIDPEDYHGLGTSNRARNDRFVITHGGSLYRKRDPRPFLTAVAELLKEKVISENELVVRFVGGVDSKFDMHGWVRGLGLEAAVRIDPPVSHPKYLELLASSDLLLVIQPDTDLQVPSKLFEYIAVGKRILALVHDGATRNVVEQYSRGKIVDPYNVVDIKKALVEYIKGEPLLDDIQIDSPDSLRFSMANLSKELDKVLTGCLAE
jgi:glycosyltransferase involved in cell wall biosynthesis